MNSMISWIGGKKALRNMIYPRMPAFERYIEVFGGAGWVLFGRQPAGEMEIYNDLNTNLVNLFRCVRLRPMELLEELGFFPLNARVEFFDLVKFLKKEEFAYPYLEEQLAVVERYFAGEDAEILKAILMAEGEMDDVKRAAAFFKVIRYSYGSSCTSYNCQPCDIRKSFYTIWEANRRLKDTVIENKDFEALIRSYDRTFAFFYCDPPYYEAESCYEKVFTKEDHERLRDVLSGIQGKFIVSYNDCQYIRELYKDYQIVAVSRLNNLAQWHAKGSQYPEVLIANFDMEEQVKKLPVQIQLNDVYGELWLPEGQGREREVVECFN